MAHHAVDRAIDGVAALERRGAGDPAAATIASPRVEAYRHALLALAGARLGERIGVRACDGGADDGAAGSGSTEIKGGRAPARHALIPAGNINWCGGK